MTGAIKMLKCEFKHGEFVVPTARSQGARPAVDTRRVTALRRAEEALR